MFEVFDRSQARSRLLDGISSLLEQSVRRIQCLSLECFSLRAAYILTHDIEQQLWVNPTRRSMNLPLCSKTQDVILPYGECKYTVRMHYSHRLEVEFTCPSNMRVFASAKLFAGRPKPLLLATLSPKKLHRSINSRHKHQAHNDQA